MKKVLSLVLSLVMLLSLVVPVSAEDTIFEGNGTLKDKTVAFTIEADKTTLYGEGEQIVKFLLDYFAHRIPMLCNFRKGQCRNIESDLSIVTAFQDTKLFKFGNQLVQKLVVGLYIARKEGGVKAQDAL